jgi:predicted branched-subunit amino acid permease
MAGAGVFLGCVWVSSTLVGALVGSAVPDRIPLDFAVPLVFLVLLVPAVTSGPAVAAAVGGGLAAVAAAELGAGGLSVMAGAVTGIAAGTLAEVLAERRAGTPGPSSGTPGPSSGTPGQPPERPA